MPRMKDTGTPASATARSARGDEGADLGRVVVADPGLEQVAEDVQRVGVARLVAQETAEQLGDVRACWRPGAGRRRRGGHAGIVGICPGLSRRNPQARVAGMLRKRHFESQS